MKIKDLQKEHPDIYKRALEQCNPGHDENSSILPAFTWKHTIEGRNIWDNIYRGNFDAFYKKYPKTQPKPELSRDELLAEVRRRYPIGTEFKCAYNSRDQGKVESDSFDSGTNRSNCISNMGEYYVYYKGKWAEIISNPKPVTEESTLDKWLRETKAKYLSLEGLIEDVRHCDFYEIYIRLHGTCLKDKAKILYDKWNSVDNAHYNNKITPKPELSKIKEWLNEVSSNTAKTVQFADIKLKKRTKRRKLNNH